MDNNKDSLGASLSDEEAEAVLKTQQAPKASPTKNQGYKFNVEQNLTDGFNFASQSKVGNGDDVNGHSSSDAEEGFEHLNVPEDSNGSDQNSAPTTPTKVVPAKRTAHGTGTATVNGSPPSSPAPKKRKQFKDYLAEDEEKKRKLEESALKESSGWRSSLIAMIIIPVVLAAAVSIGISLYNASTQPKSNISSKPRYTWRKASSNFFNWTQDLSSEFPMQNKETWIALIASITSTMEKSEPGHPAAITVLYPPSVSQEFATCFLRKIGRVVNRAIAPLLGGDTESPAEVKIIEYSTFTSTSSFSKFRPDIEDYFKNRGKAVITIDIDKFKSEDALLQFHGLCDNFHAVDKRATLFFPVRVPELYLDKFEWIHERGGDISNDVLTEAWKSVLSSDTGPALVARVTDTVILLNEGDSCSL